MKYNSLKKLSILMSVLFIVACVEESSPNYENWSEFKEKKIYYDVAGAGKDKYKTNYFDNGMLEKMTYDIYTDELLSVDENETYSISGGSITIRSLDGQFSETFLISYPHNINAVRFESRVSSSRVFYKYNTLEDAKNWYRIF